MQTDARVMSYQVIVCADLKHYRAQDAGCWLLKSGWVACMCTDTLSISVWVNLLFCSIWKPTSTTAHRAIFKTRQQWTATVTLKFKSWAFNYSFCICVWSISPKFCQSLTISLRYHAYLWLWVFSKVCCLSSEKRVKHCEDASCQNQK